MSRPRLINGARLLCYVNGRLWGEVTSFSFDSDNVYKEARGVDSPFVQEFMPGASSVSGSLGLVRTISSAGLQGQGIIPPQYLMAQAKYFTLELVERFTDTTVFRSDFTVVRKESWTAVAKDLMRGSLTFAGVTWTNEIG